MGEMKAFIQGLGMLTPVGGGAAQTAASVRAGISAYEDSSIHNRNFKPMTLALVPEEMLPPLHQSLEETLGLSSREIRMLRLAQPALEEAVASLENRSEMPLFLALPEPGPGATPGISEDFLKHLAVQTAHVFHLEDSAAFPHGRAAGMFALQAAFEHLGTGKSTVIVGGVDTFLDLYLLSKLDLEDRILAEGVMDGFAPGEGAAFMILSSIGGHGDDNSRGVVRVHEPGIDIEEGHRYSDKPYRGDGLANAVRNGVKDAAGTPITTVFGSLNGESIGAKEWGVALTRNTKNFSADFRLEHPADCFGDSGAACGPLLISIAAVGLTNQTYRGPTLIWCSSDTEARGAAVLNRHRSC